MTGGGLGVEMIRQRLKTRDENAQSPLQSPAHRTANAPQRETFQQQALDQGALFGRDELWLKALDKLAATVLTLIVLCAVVHVTIFLVWR